MKSLWARYVEEVGNPDIFIEHSWGFVSYEIHADALYMVDIYVVPEEREKGRTRELVSEVEAIARSLEKKYLRGTVQPRNPYATISMAGHIALGFICVAAEPGKVWFEKELTPKSEETL